VEERFGLKSGQWLAVYKNYIFGKVLQAEEVGLLVEKDFAGGLGDAFAV
jgi:hypothetical protein